MDIKKELPKILKKGNVAVGEKKSIAYVKMGKAKMLIAAKNCHYLEILRRYSKEFGIDLVKFSGDSSKLGALCKKPFPVSSLVVIKEGGSRVVK